MRDRWGEYAAGQFVILAKIAHCFLEHRLGSTIPALLRGTGIEADAVQANTHVGAATMATFSAARLAGQIPFPAATMTMSSGTHAGIVSALHKLHKPQNLISAKINLKIFEIAILQLESNEKRM